MLIIADEHAYRSVAGDIDQAERWFDEAAQHVATVAERASLAGALGEQLAFRRSDSEQAIAQEIRARSEFTAQNAVTLEAEL